MFGFRFWFLTGPERNGLVAQHRKHTHNHSKDLDFGFGFLPVLSEMGEIREFRSFLVIQNLNLRTKVHQMLIFLKKYAKFPKSRPKLAKFGQNSIFSGEIQISEP
jgi:hypothetical protein